MEENVHFCFQILVECLFMLHLSILLAYLKKKLKEAKINDFFFFGGWEEGCVFGDGVANLLFQHEAM